MEEVRESYYIVVVNGTVVASAACPPGMEVAGRKEAFHYAREYALYGPVLIAKVVYEIPQE